MSRSNQTPNAPNAPISFKTVPGRNRTQKWNKAPAYNYDGDDWGGYDPYDESTYDEPAPPIPAQAPYATQPLPSQQQQGLSHGRNHSFDRGDERRQFSSSAAASAFPAYEERRPSRGAAPSSAASAGRGSNDMPRSGSRPRDFTNPDQAPPPLVTRASPAPTEWFPPRKSSLKGGDYESAAAAAEARKIAESVAQSSSPSSDKPLPFIRPSDIYKRIPEEMRRQSEESSRPSMDSLQRTTSPPAHPILTPVAEARESKLFMDADVPKVEDRSGNVGARQTPTATQLPSIDTGAERKQIPKGGSPTLPDVQRFSGFGDDFLSGGAPTGKSTTSDPAAEILAERQHAVPVDAIPKQNTTDLQHQPSQGFRSAVHQAFDRSDNSPPISRDSSRSDPNGSSVSRSDTTSTAGISPIMSRVPSAATAQFRQQQRLDEQVPSIAEEPSTSPHASRPASGAYATQAIPRKPSPGRGRNVSEETSRPADFEPGYRRSLDPPSTGTSPARTPALETATKRLSSPMSAVPMTEAEAPDVDDQGAEVPEPNLHPARTPASEVSDIDDPDLPTKPLPIQGRGRSGTDYSIREADIADTVNSSPDKGVSSPSIAQAQRDSQKLFLETHATPTSERGPGLRDGSRSHTGTPTHGSRAGSPAKGRVREIADKYQEIHNASRRNSATSMHSSKSSWSQFDKPTLSRQGTAQSPIGGDSQPAPVRPELDREESFKPDLPGGWVSTAPTPALESPPPQSSPMTARDATTPQPETPIDLTPTTKKYQLSSGPGSSDPANNSQSAFDAAKSIGEQLGASLLSTVGMGHQTRDFASAQTAAPVDQPEMRPKPATGDISMQPPLMRLQSDSTDAATSVASSVAPTPPAKDTPKGDMLGVSAGSGGYFNAVAPLRIRSREASPEHSQPTGQAPVLPALSTSEDASDMDSDRLRKEIVRSLDPLAQNETPRASMENAQRTQDALNAPDNERRIEQELPPAPAAEATASRPGFLNTRFSWENETLGATGTKAAAAPEPHSPEIKPETAYERPRSRQLHVVNAAISPVSPTDKEATASSQSAAAGLGLTSVLSAGGDSATGNLVSPVTKSQEHLLPDASLQPGGSPSMRDIAPSPISDTSESFTTRLPSYYLGYHEPELPEAPEKDHTNSSTMSQPTSPSQPRTTTVPAASIPPFRNILALKTSDERIKTYNDTRQTFADMNTGLGDWLAKMLEYHPEHAGLSTADTGFKPSALQTQTSTFKRGHKANPSLAKFTDQFRSGSGQRNASIGSTEGEAAAKPASPATEGSRIDMDRMQQQMQQRGKEFMKNASVFGGKASSGAKGLFAKGKSRFGGGSVRGKPNSNYEVSVTPSTGSAVDGTARDARPDASKLSVALPSSPLSTTISTAITGPTIEPFHVEEENIASPATPITAIPLTAAESDAKPAVPPKSDEASEKDSHTPLNDVRTPVTAIPVNDMPGAFPVTTPGIDDVSTLMGNAEESEVRDGTLSATEKDLRMEIGEDSRENEDHLIERPPASAQATTLESATTEDTKSASVVGGDEIGPSSISDGGVVTTELPEKTTSALVATTGTETIAMPAGGPQETSTETPSRRPSTKTPSSSRASSRPLSQVFERLKEKTRSVSRSPTASARKKKESSRSRPTSMVFSNTDDAQPEDDEVGEFKVMGVRSTQRGVESWEGERPPHRRSFTAPSIPGPGYGRRTMSMAMPTRTEVWNEPDAQLPPETPRSAGPGRLGILPSPAPTLLTFEDAGAGVRRASLEVAKRRSSNAPREGGVNFREGMFGEELGTVPSAGESEEGAQPEENQVEQEKPKVIRRGSDLATLPSQQASRPSTGKQTAWLKEEEDEDVSPTRPQGRYFIANAMPRERQVSNESESFPRHQRRVSDLATLPSQRIATGRPDSQVLVPLKTSGDVESSPTTVKGVSPTEDEMYETTPTATTSTFQRVGSTGHEKKIAEMEREIAAVAATAGAEQVATQAPVSLPPAPDISRPTTSEEQQEDTRSEVSAEEGAPRHDSGKPGPSLSRHSSVSSLGDPEKDMLAPGTAEPTLLPSEARDLVMSAQAIPAGPSPEEVRQRERRPHMHDRPLSYAPLPRDRQGLIREEINTNPMPDGSPVQADLGGMSGPPTGTPPFQQHPVFRAQAQPTEYEQLRQSVISPDHEQLRQSIGSPSQDQKRRSGFFRSRKNTAENIAPTATGAPAAFRIGDDHGLEDLHHFDEPAPQPQPQPQTDAELKQARRGSGIWNAFSRRSSRSGVRPESSHSQFSEVRPVSRQLERVDEGPSKLRKPQRAPSQSVDLEQQKKKRFSKLGSLFGRREGSTGVDSSRTPSTAAKDPPKTNRLSKKSGVRRSETVQEHRPENSSTVSGSVRGYEAYEAMRRRDLPAWQETQGRYQQPPPGSQSAPTSAVLPPADGWYGPSSRDEASGSREEAPIEPQTTPTRLPEFRRLHSSGGVQRHSRPIPEAFRPTSAAYGGSVEPIGPPPGHEPPFRVMSPEQMAYAHGARPSEVRRMSGDRPPGNLEAMGMSAARDAPTRVMSPPQMGGPPVAHRIPTGSPTAERVRQGSDVSQLSRQVSAQAGYHRGSVSPISPTREQRLGSLGQQVSPMPRDPYSDRSASYSDVPAPPIPAPRRPPLDLSAHGLPQNPYYPSQQIDPRATGPPQQGRPIPWEDTQPVRQQQMGPYPTPPRSFTAPEQHQQRIQNYPPTSPSHIYYQQQQPRPPQQNRYYAQQNRPPSQPQRPPSQRIPSGPQDPFAPPRHQRRPSGYSGRRDDPTVGEEDLIMRGASYPGQEWAPTGLGRGEGWD